VNLLELLQIVRAHGIDSQMLGSVNVVLITKNANGHVWSGDIGELDGAGETLITLGIIVLQADLKLDGLEKVALLGFLGIFLKLVSDAVNAWTWTYKQFLDVLTDAGDRDLGHLDECSLPIVNW
jgi:hypothetical protein